MKEAQYEIVEDEQGKPLVIRDVGPWHVYPTVTNDAEGVIERLKDKLQDGRQLFYIDSEGHKDEILIDDEGKFGGFKTI